MCQNDSGDIIRDVQPHNASNNTNY